MITTSRRPHSGLRKASPLSIQQPASPSNLLDGGFVTHTTDYEQIEVIASAPHATADYRETALKTPAKAVGQSNVVLRVHDFACF